MSWFSFLQFRNLLIKTAIQNNADPMNACLAVVKQLQGLNASAPIDDSLPMRDCGTILQKELLDKWNAFIPTIPIDDAMLLVRPMIEHFGEFPQTIRQGDREEGAKMLEDWQRQSSVPFTANYLSHKLFEAYMRVGMSIQHAFSLAVHAFGLLLSLIPGWIAHERDPRLGVMMAMMVTEGAIYGELKHIKEDTIPLLSSLPYRKS
jgi:hypothetical protein